MTDMEQVTQVANGVSDYGMMAVTAAVSCVAVLFIGIAKEFYDFFSGEEFDLHDSSVLPLKFKMGEDADGNVVYHTFETVDELSDFYLGAIKYINNCINEGWTEKDGIDTDKLLEGA